MDLIVPLVSAFIGVSAAFLLTLGISDHLPEAWLRFRARKRLALDALASARHPLIPRTIRQTQLD
jgi:hypothetical protein